MKNKIKGGSKFLTLTRPLVSLLEFPLRESRINSGASKTTLDSLVMTAYLIVLPPTKDAVAIT